MLYNLFFEYSCGGTLTTQPGWIFAHKTLGQDVGGFPFLMQWANGLPPSKFRHMAPNLASLFSHMAPTLVKMVLGKVSFIVWLKIGVAAILVKMRQLCVKSFRSPLHAEVTTAACQCGYKWHRFSHIPCSGNGLLWSCSWSISEQSEIQLHRQGWEGGSRVKWTSWWGCCSWTKQFWMNTQSSQF